MALILNLDTATEVASVCISKDGVVLAELENLSQKEHASFLHVAIRDAAQQADILLSQLDAVSVTHGPGSYTGLRVGLATAKGLCYGLNIPLIACSTLQMMGMAAKEYVFQRPKQDVFLCPIIDARRMEVFTAVYDNNLREVMKEQALVVDATIFDILLTNEKVMFFGSGSTKVQAIITHENAIFADVKYSAKHLVNLAEQAFAKKAFANVAYAQPNYLKEFYSPASNK